MSPSRPVAHRADCTCPPPGTVRRRLTALRATGLVIAATGVVTAVLPLTGASPGAAAAPAAIGGYTTSAWSTPVRVEIYEPTIPLPASPQLELEVGYAHAQADSSGSSGRASYLWPGDPIGQGFTTIVDQFGLPPQLGEDGYPIQVNATAPGGPSRDSAAPVPGTVQRATAGPGHASAENGFSSDDKPATGSSGSGGSGGGLPGLPSLPGLPGLSGLGGHGKSGGSVGGVVGGVVGGLLGSQASTSHRHGDHGLTGTLDGALQGTVGGLTSDLQRTPVTGPLVATLDHLLGGGTGSRAAAGPGLPPELAALVDVGSATATASTDAVTTGDAQVSARSHSAVGDVSLLGGLVSVDSVSSTATAVGDGQTARAGGDATYATITALGQRFRVGPDGVQAVGQRLPIPGLSGSAASVLGQLGLTVTVPQAHYAQHGDTATATRDGLIVQFDLTKLKSRLNAIPLARIVDLLPDQAGQLKSLVQAAAGLSPRIVVTLAHAEAHIDTAAPVDVPAGGDPTSTPTSTPSGAGTGSSGRRGSGSSGPGGTSPVGSSTPVSSVGAPTQVPSDVVPTAAPLPGLFSLSSALILGGLLIAGGIGWAARTAGVAALGGGAPCSAGLRSGLPDLRRAP